MSMCRLLLYFAQDDASCEELSFWEERSFFRFWNEKNGDEEKKWWNGTCLANEQKISIAKIFRTTCEAFVRPFVSATIFGLHLTKSICFSLSLCWRWHCYCYVEIISNCGRNTSTNDIRITFSWRTASSFSCPLVFVSSVPSRPLFNISVGFLLIHFDWLCVFASGCCIIASAVVSHKTTQEMHGESFNFCSFYEEKEKLVEFDKNCIVTISVAFVIRPHSAVASPTWTREDKCDHFSKNAFSARFDSFFCVAHRMCAVVDICVYLISMLLSFPPEKKRQSCSRPFSQMNK